MLAREVRPLRPSSASTSRTGSTRRQGAAMSDVFICYRRDEGSGWAHLIRTRLQEQLGEAHVFMDVTDVALGKNYKDEIEQAVGGSTVVVALIGPRWTSLS